ncbi:MAG: toll/interleukin-1 receptor domain-containing protein [Bacteriovoracales bacterium]|nr:toll/interleukin-1 receptor domain-containing protein [Bacteriovoracales bacterium]
MPNFKIKKKLDHLRREFSICHKGSRYELLNKVVISPVYIDEAFEEYGDSFGHRLIFYVSESLYLEAKVQRKQLEDKISESFNKALRAVDDEYILDVLIELHDPSDLKCQQAISSSGIVPLSEGHEHLWKQGHLKLFISHRDSHKKDVSLLAEHLLSYGISCFVAHEDIEPTEEWRREIERALRSMDVFLAFLTEDFYKGVWTSQEVGFAIAMGTPFIPLKVSNKDPQGFMGTLQALRACHKNMEEAAEKIFETICKRFDALGITRKAVISSFTQSPSYRETINRFKKLKKIKENFTIEEEKALVEAFNENDQLSGCVGINSRNQFLKFLNSRSQNTYRESNYKIEQEIVTPF